MVTTNVNFVIFQNELINLNTIVTISKDRITANNTKTNKSTTTYLVVINNDYKKEFSTEKERDAYYDEIITAYNTLKEEGE